MSAIRYLTAISLLLVMLPLRADITGLWRTIDDETGQDKSIVEIYQKDGRYYGKVVQLMQKPADTLCDKCQGNDYNKPIVGMVILNDMQQSGDVYDGGRILDPAKGKIYRCKLWLEDGQLKVRGYLGFLFRTQTWLRPE